MYPGAARIKEPTIPARTYHITAHWDDETRLWWAESDDIPLHTEAPTFEALVDRALAIAPEIIALNEGIGEAEAAIEIVAERRSTVRIPA